MICWECEFPIVRGGVDRKLPGGQVVRMHAKCAKYWDEEQVDNYIPGLERAFDPGRLKE
jgi:hypothetical protein